MYLPFVLIFLAFIATTVTTTSLLASLLDAAFWSLATPSSRIGFFYSASQRCHFLIFNLELLLQLLRLSLIIFIALIAVGDLSLLWCQFRTRSENHDEQMIAIDNMRYVGEVVDVVSCCGSREMILDDVVVGTIKIRKFENLNMWATLVYFGETLALHKTMGKLAKNDYSFFLFILNPYDISGHPSRLVLFNYMRYAIYTAA